MKNWINLSTLLISIPFLFAVSIAGWRVDYFQISDHEGQLIFSSPAANGNKFTTIYIHSVELTPVEDDYRIIGGSIWMWEERVRSSNAGLPSVKPVNGRFINNGELFIYQGGRRSVKEYYYRIGNQYFGLNQADFEPFGRKDLYKIFNGERLLISVTTKNLVCAKLIRLRESAPTPTSSPASRKTQNLYSRISCSA